MNDLERFKWLDPDSVGGGAEPHSVFFVNGELFVDPNDGWAHRKYFNRGTDAPAARLRAALAPTIERLKADGVADPWFNLYSIHLFGRIGTVIEANDASVQVVSFWGRGSDWQNAKAKGPTDQIPACVAKLLDRGFIEPGAVVVYGDGRTAVAGELVGGGAAQGQVDPEAVKRNELARKLHLLRGDEKKAAAKELGVGGGGKRNDWDDQLVKSKLMPPGHSHWRMNSEDNFSVRLKRALNESDG